VREQEAAKGALQRLLSSFFGGRVSALTAQLLESEQLSPSELAALRALIDDKEG
jgi:BlaI family penicillinase repressor